MRLLESIDKTANRNVEILFMCDDDDPEITSYTGFPIITGPAYNFCMKIHTLARLAQGNILMLCADDVVFVTKGWDDALRTCEDDYPDGIWCASLWDGSNGKENKEDGTRKLTHPHPAVSRRVYETLGYVANPIFEHFCCDAWLTEIFSAIDRFKYFPDYMMAHLRAGLVKGVPKDDTYNRLRPNGRGIISSRDRTVARDLARYMQADIELLRSKMDVF